MYAGRIVEQGPVVDVLTNPQHPYTQGLIDCVPHLEPEPPVERKTLTEIPGVVPALHELGSGCSFAPRCNKVFDQCHHHKPLLQKSSQNQQVACLLHGREE